MKRFKTIFTAVGLLAAVLTHQAAAAAESSSYGPKSKRFGAGLYLGDPTGLTLKGYLTERLALDAIVAWSFIESSFTLIGDVTYDILDIPVNASSFTLPFYAGAGGKVGFDKGGNGDGETIAAIRVPVGVAMQFVNYPIEVFLEVAPGVQIIQETEFDLTGGIGARFYFF
jgi:hypothetical protein